MSKDTDRLLGHADGADGIEEYDNPLPDWWLGLLWLTIIWAIGYSVWFFGTDQSQVGWYESEVAAADERYPEQAEAEIRFAFSESAAAEGAVVYAENCFACHGTELEGGIGPGFLDDEWIHGGQASQVIAVIRDGVMEKGMVAWGGILSPEQINQVASYVLQQHAAATGRSMDEISAPPTDEGAPDSAVSPDTLGSPGDGA